MAKKSNLRRVVLAVVIVSQVWGLIILLHKLSPFGNLQTKLFRICCELTICDVHNFIRHLLLKFKLNFSLFLGSQLRDLRLEEEGDIALWKQETGGIFRRCDSRQQRRLAAVSCRKQELPEAAAVQPEREPRWGSSSLGEIRGILLFHIHQHWTQEQCSLTGLRSC